MRQVRRMTEMKTMIKTASEKGRIDVVISDLFSISRSQAQKAIKAKNVRVNGLIIDTPSFKVTEGMEIDYEPLINEAPAVLKPKETLELDYVYRDEDIAIVNKPRGLVVHPAPGHVDDTLVNHLFDEENFDFDPNDRDNERPGIVHRIDKDTSGLLVCMQRQEEKTSALKRVMNLHFYFRMAYMLKSQWN